MEYIKLKWDWCTYEEDDYSSDRMRWLGFFLAIDVMDIEAIDRYREWFKADTQQIIKGGMTFLEKRDSKVVIGCAWSLEASECHFEFPKEQIICLMERFYEAAKKEEEMMIVEDVNFFLVKGAWEPEVRNVGTKIIVLRLGADENYSEEILFGDDSWFLSMFLNEDLGSSQEFFKNFINDPVLISCDKNSMWVHKKGDSVLIGYDWAKDFYDANYITIPQREFVSIIDQWTMIKKRRPLEIAIYRKGDIYTVEGHDVSTRGLEDIVKSSTES